MCVCIYIYIYIYIWNLEKWWNYFQGKNGDEDVENELVDTAGEGAGGTN